MAIRVDFQVFLYAGFIRIEEAAHWRTFLFSLETGIKTDALKCLHLFLGCFSRGFIKDGHGCVLLVFVFVLDLSDFADEKFFGLVEICLSLALPFLLFLQVLPLLGQIFGYRFALWFLSLNLLILAALQLALFRL